MACEIAKGRMYATKEVVELQKEVEILRDDKTKLTTFIINNWHHCPIPIEVVCKCGFKEEGCVE